jgi:hypothetical protein
MARLHYAGYPTRVALAVVIDRARTYLLRARVHKQNYERARIQANGTGSDVILATATREAMLAQCNRLQARYMLVEAELMSRDRRYYVPPGAKGASDLDGKNFQLWPQYPYECPPKEDIWLRRNGYA